jgi:SAM-dependent methyltransferase
MGEVFGEYSEYYNLLYKNKDFHGEADYIDELINHNYIGAKNVLDLGCGTGRHAALLAAKGYHVHGVDLSDKMLAIAEKSKEQSDPKIRNRLLFSQGNICNLILGQKFDVITALFHVISYLSSNDDLASFLATAKKHLKPNGIIIFDCWYGPAVLSDPPVVRIKRMENEKIKITRTAKPVVHYCENSVDVNYQIVIKNKLDGTVVELKEKHTMRYLFHPEIRYLFSQIGLSFQSSHEWMTDKTPGADTWGVCFVGKNK